MRNYRQSAHKNSRVLGMILTLSASLVPAFAQSRSTSELTAALVEPQDDSTQAQSAPLTLTLQDALERAQKNDAQFLSVVNDAKLAQEDRIQARASLLPSFNLRSEYLNTQGDGVLPTGRYVTNDGVHVYREWGVFRQDLSPTVLLRTGYRRAVAAEALAQSRAEIARRGLGVTVTRAYYTLIITQRKYATAQQALEQAKNLLIVSQNLEHGGEVAHSDVIKFELQYDAQERAFREAKLAMAGARLDLAVLLFSQFDQNFDIVDDLKLAPALPSFAEIEQLAKRENPDLRVAIEALHAANQDVSIARQAFLPSLAVDVDYGIEANSVALRSFVSADRSVGRLPNLGYFLTATMTVPVWNWGGTRSKLRQAELKRQQAKVELSATQRQLLRNLYGFYQEAGTAKEELASLRHSAERAAESLRLTTLRYQAGEATVLEVVDAQNTLTQARNVYDDGEVRYSVALAKVQTVTGRF
jgi:outer membrane protein TolC